VRWEFWPAWAAYLPLIPYLIWLAIKYRSATLFTVTNPGMPASGFAGESKSQILGHLSSSETIAPYTLVAHTLSAKARVQKGLEFVAAHGFPVVVKPDAGERGKGVRIVRAQADLERHLWDAGEDLILQQYIPGPEFGVFYQRAPRERAGRITSITEKRFPTVTGDGRTSVAELILRDSRAVCLASIYLSRSLRPPSDVPDAGEIVPLVEIGSHCRGAVFRDGMHLKTPALEAAIDRVSNAHPGFYLGRFDLRSPSIEAFQHGIFQIIELNGVTSEPTHIYDPAVSLVGAYRALFTQWRAAFEIGAINREMGVRPMRIAQFVRLILASQKPLGSCRPLLMAKDATT
jgi:hypothetical protein